MLSKIFLALRIFMAVAVLGLFIAQWALKVNPPKPAQPDVYGHQEQRVLDPYRGFR